MEREMGRGAQGRGVAGLTRTSSCSSCWALVLSSLSASSLLVAAACSSASSRCSKPWYLPGEALAPTLP